MNNSSSSRKEVQISVVMSVYHGDHASYFSQALQSVLDQTYQAAEIILVRDGQVGADIEDLLRTYEKHPLIKVIRLPHNKGLAHALNRAIETARYPWIARMDADDICMPHRFEFQADYISKHPEVDVVGSSILEFEGEEMVVRSERKVPQFDQDIKKRGRLMCPINHPTVMYKKSSFNEIGGYSENVFPEDYYLWLQMFQQDFKFYNIQEPLVYMRVDQGMINRRSGLGYLKKELKFLKTARRERLLSPGFYMVNVGVRTGFRLLPVRLLERSYVRFFRKTTPQQ